MLIVFDGLMNGYLRLKYKLPGTVYNCTQYNLCVNSVDFKIRSLSLQNTPCYLCSIYDTCWRFTDDKLLFKILFQSHIRPYTKTPSGKQYQLCKINLINCL